MEKRVLNSHGSAWKDMPGRPNPAGDRSRVQRFPVQAKSVGVIRLAFGQGHVSEKWESVSSPATVRESVLAGLLAARPARVIYGERTGR